MSCYSINTDHNLTGYTSKNRLDRMILVPFLLLLGIALAHAASLQFIIDAPYYGQYFFRLLVYIPVGLGLAWFLCCLGIKRMIDLSWFPLVTGLALLFASLLWDDYGRIAVGGYTIMLIPLAGVLCTIGIAGVMQVVAARGAGCIIAVFFCALATIFLFWRLDQLLWATSIAVMTIAVWVRLFRQGALPCKKWVYHFMLVLCITMSAVLIADTLFVNIGRNLAAWIDPYAYRDTFGYLNYHTRVLLQGAVSFGPSTAIPADQTGLSACLYSSDACVLLYLITQYGWVPGLFVTGLLCAFTWSLCRSAHRARATEGANLAMACCIPMILQVMAALCINFGFYFEGLFADVPFLSVGGLSLIATMMLTGVALSAAHKQRCI